MLAPDEACVARPLLPLSTRHAHRCGYHGGHRFTRALTHMCLHVGCTRAHTRARARGRAGACAYDHAPARLAYIRVSCWTRGGGMAVRVVIADIRTRWAGERDRWARPSTARWWTSTTLSTTSHAPGSRLSSHEGPSSSLLSSPEGTLLEAAFVAAGVSESACAMQAMSRRFWWHRVWGVCTSASGPLCRSHGAASKEFQAVGTGHHAT